mgnify:CR=1 FL=1
MSRSSKIELLYFCVLIESLAGYAYDEKHNGRHTDGKHDDLYPHGTKHAKHDKDATFAYQIVETDRTFTYDAAGKLVSATETEDNYGTYIYTYEYDLMGNRTYMEKTLNGTVAEWHKYEYNESNQLVSEQLYNGKKTTSLAYTYDADGNRITETGKVGTDKVEIIRMAREIGTYETSILPYEDCCTVFTPRHPATRPVLEDVVQAESVLDIDGLVAKALEGETWVRVKP